MRLEMPCSQKDLTIQQLRDQVGQDSVTLQIPSAERLLELQRQLADKERALQESQSQVCLKLHEAEDKISQLESALEHTQCELLKARGKSDTNGSRSDEMEMLMTDLERVNQRAVAAEQDSVLLRDQLSDMDSSSPPPPSSARDTASPSRAALELQLASKDKEISQLVEDIRKLQSAVDSLKETSASQIAQLEGMLAEKSRIIQELEDRLDRQKDYEDIKNELRNLKMLEDSDNPSDDQDEKPTLVSSNNNNNNCVDLVLYGKNRTRLSPPLPKDDAGSPRSRLQNVEAFGSLLGEEIVSSFSRMLKSEQPQQPIVSSPPATPKSVDADAMSTGTDTSTGSGRGGPDEAAGATPPTPDPVMGASLERLQECLRQNMERHACEALNTQNVAHAVRELLSAHNVGQRLFARFVLGLSQGTVSELLSKPKPWDKLTEKGRDSYRKMHAWASDDFCVFMLKSLVPKKGKESGGSSASSRQEDAAAEERIAQILSEAQQAMTIPMSKERSPAPPSSGAQNGAADDPHADSDQDGDTNNANSTQSAASHKDAKRSSRKYENDDIPQEMVARIYQEELAKLMGQRVEESFRQQQYDRTHEEIRQALSIYHHELSRLSQLALTPGHEFARFGAAALPGALLNGAFPGLSLGPELRGGPGAAAAASAAAAAAAAARVAAADSAEAMRAAHEQQQQPPTSQHQRRGGSSLAAQLAPRDWHKQRGGNKYSSAFSLVRPGVKFPGSGSTPSPPGAAGVLGLSDTPPGGAAPEDLGSSPLQRMQSITNSLLTQTATPTMPTTNQRQNKAVLPPITQQQFDQYNNLNTEEIVKKVKEQLSQYSISQRLFGENVLGLSQGSVSDLLARPKPWHMLTQKGREPFIRMKIFLEDENAVHKLVASQYKIAPEKLMRTSGFTAASSPLAGSSKLPASSAAAARAAAARDLPSHRNSHCDSASPLLGKSPFSASPELQVALMQQHHQQQQQQQQQQQDSRVAMYAPPSSPTAAARKGHSHHPSGGGGRSLPYVQPSVYEMAALTTDLDTQTITAKIKETLMAHNIGQKIFGEAVLGLSQGSVSELLSKPKPWHMLSIKGREPFIRMQLWLNDPHNVEKLQVIKNERREANKRRRTHVDLEAAPRPMEAQPPSLPALTPGAGSFPFAAPSSPFPAAKKPRVLFSDEQKEALRLAFSMDPYPSTATIEFLANELGLSVRTITNWFHNHRMRLKQHVVSPGPDDNQPRSEPSTLLGPPPGSREGSASFDPALFRGLLVQRLAEMHGSGGDKSGPSAFGAGAGGALSLNAYNSYSPSSQQGNDEGTLDLSMSSSQASSGRRTWARGGGTPTEDLDDSNLSQDEPATAGSDRDSLKEESISTPSPAPPRNASVGALGQHNSYSSRRRKPAAPKWVDPGLSPDSDDAEDDEAGANVDDDCGAVGGDAESAIINGVCVRQTAAAGDFGLRLRETVRVDPVAAADDARKSAERDDLDEDDDEEEETALELCTTAKKSSSGDGMRKLEQRLDNRGEERGEDWEF
ncbi:homeobox protein, cut isoform X3 [Rhipicephalus microplus]|uniref:homeobox protein, cut isoform X3 n=1 Tax=Rhipicephalus microplus TaxID=6941 RepID=UPI003F6A7552